MTVSVIATGMIVVMGMTAGASEPPLVLGDIAGFDPTPPAMVSTADGAAWVGWVDNQCFGEFRVQRIDADRSLLVPGGLALDIQDDCATFHATLAACPDHSVVAVCAPHPFPAQRFDGSGNPMWGPGVVVSETAAIGGTVALPGGDVLFSWYEGSTIFVARYDTNGTAVWSEPAAVSTSTGPSKRIVALVPDGADGAFVIWDEPFSYVRSIWAARVSGSGEVLWDEPFNVVPIDGPPSATASSRHTDPVALEDGQGGVVLVWTFGRESSQTIAALLMQVITPDGTGVFEPEGRPVSLRLSRQYDPVLTRDPASGDVLVTWRDGGFDAQQLGVQRMTLTGQRAWGDDGVIVTPLGVGVSHFDASWNDDLLSLIVGDETPDPADASVVVHQLDTAGDIAAEPTPVSGPLPTGPVQGIALDDTLVVSWFETPANGRVLARRLDDAQPVPGDTNEDGLVGILDLLNVILDFGTDGSANGGDVNGDGIVDVSDLVLVILSWSP